MHFLDHIPFIKSSKPDQARLEQLSKLILKFKNVEELVQEADNLYVNRDYVGAYYILNRMKFANNVEPELTTKHAEKQPIILVYGIQKLSAVYVYGFGIPPLRNRVRWRLARALYRISMDKTLPKLTRYELITEGYDLVQITLDMDVKHPEVYKYAALLLYEKSGMETFANRITTAEQVKNHLIRTHEENPNDYTVLYSLGSMCYCLANLNWFQRFLAKCLWAEPPKSTYNEAFEFFMKAENLKPHHTISNVYMLADTSRKMGYNYRAYFYFTVAAAMQPRTDCDAEKVKRAKMLAKSLGEYHMRSTSYVFGERK